MRGLIGVPHTGLVPWEFSEALRSLDMPEDCEIHIGGIANSVVHIGREATCALALQNNFDWIVMIDSDMVPEPQTIKKLLRHNKEIVSAPCFKRTPPFTPCFYKKLAVENNRVVIDPCTEWPDRLFEVQGVGAACLLIRTSALKKMQAPYFYPLPTTGEDISFCMRAQKAGIPIYIDPLIRCGHIGTRVCYEEDYRGVIR